MDKLTELEARRIRRIAAHAIGEEESIIKGRQRNIRAIGARAAVALYFRDLGLVLEEIGHHLGRDQSVAQKMIQRYKKNSEVHRLVDRIKALAEQTEHDFSSVSPLDLPKQWVELHHKKAEVQIRMTADPIGVWSVTFYNAEGREKGTGFSNSLEVAIVNGFEAATIT